MQFSLNFDETFATLVVKGLRKLPIEEAGQALEAFVKECNKQVEAQKDQEEPKEAEIVE